MNVKSNMFTEGGSHARLLSQQGTGFAGQCSVSLCLFFYALQHDYGSLQSTYCVIYFQGMF